MSDSWSFGVFLRDFEKVVDFECFGKACWVGAGHFVGLCLALVFGTCFGGVNTFGSFECSIECLFYDLTTV